MILTLLLSLFLQTATPPPTPPAPPPIAWSQQLGLYTPSCPSGYSVWQHITFPYPPPSGATVQDGLLVIPAPAGVIYTSQAMSLFCRAN